MSLTSYQAAPPRVLIMSARLYEIKLKDDPALHELYELL